MLKRPSRRHSYGHGSFQSLANLGLHQREEDAAAARIIRKKRKSIGRRFDVTIPTEPDRHTSRVRRNCAPQRTIAAGTCRCRWTIPWCSWTLVITVCVIWSMIWSPVEIAFNLESYKLNYVIEIVFLLDIFANTIVAQEVESDHTVCENTVLYLKGWFLIDAASSIPSTWLEALYGVRGGGKERLGEHPLKFVKALKVMRLRIVRVVKITRTALSLLSSSFSHIITPALRKMFQLVFYFCVYVTIRAVSTGPSAQPALRLVPLPVELLAPPVVGDRRARRLPARLVRRLPSGLLGGLPLVLSVPRRAGGQGLRRLLATARQGQPMEEDGSTYSNHDLLLFSSLLQFIGVFVLRHRRRLGHPCQHEQRRSDEVRAHRRAHALSQEPQRRRRSGSTSASS